jgi:transcriptional repressor NrdR
MRCPFCNHPETSVKDSREASAKNAVRRRRVCVNCNARFSTLETPILKELVVIKRSGAKRPFDKSKISLSISTAMRKRAVDEKQIEDMVNRICIELYSSAENEIPTRKIGDLILAELAKVDEVAYIRFASVYKDFMTTQDFSRFINIIKKDKTK